ncbi:MAG: hypothetical protein H8D94_01995 [Candidatus Pelagibacter sp.]|nr:hypothetical protein [Candidatus Pelagibacter sp.]
MNQKQIIEKFNKLRFRIEFNHRNKVQPDSELRDLVWVKRQIEDLSGGVVLLKSDFICANNLWKQYSDTDDKYDEWYVIDSYIEDDRIISAIKEYRRKHNCSLKEAKDTIDARQMKLKGKI